MMVDVCIILSLIAGVSLGICVYNLLKVPIRNWYYKYKLGPMHDFDWANMLFDVSSLTYTCNDYTEVLDFVTPNVVCKKCGTVLPLPYVCFGNTLEEYKSCYKSKTSWIAKSFFGCQPSASCNEEFLSWLNDEHKKHMQNPIVLNCEYLKQLIEQLS